MKRSQCAFAFGARTSVFNTWSDIDRRTSSTAGAKMPSRSWTRKRYVPSSGRPQELAPFDKLREQDECDSRGVVRASRSDLAFDITDELLPEEQILGCQLRAGVKDQTQQIEAAHAVLLLAVGVVGLGFLVV